jgi:hypothetical protein
MGIENFLILKGKEAGFRLFSPVPKAFGLSKPRVFKKTN